MKSPLPRKTMIRSAIVAAVAAFPPMIVPSLLLPPHTSTGARAGLFLGAAAAWQLLALLAGAFRWSTLGVWRPGWRPCLCDMPVRCWRHHSSPREQNRPGVVAARLAEREGA